MRRYVGITIGPIIETMSYTSTPAGLWTASYFFSELTESLYKHLQKMGYRVMTVPEDVQNYQLDGIGQYHDRIYAAVPEETANEKAADEVQKTIDTVIGEKARLVSGALSVEQEAEMDKIEACLKAYLQIHFVIMEIEDTQVLAQTLSGALDSLENCQGIVGNLTQNPLVRLVSGEKNNANCYIKKYGPFEKAEMLNEKNRDGKIEKVKDLPSVFPNQKYFAIVQADGDGMGKVVNADFGGGEKVSLEEQEKRIQVFSELCMRYTGEASKMIQDYNGVVIYAGGDDLLFLAPVVNGSEDIWKLCRNIAGKFNEIFHPAYNEDAAKIVSSDKVPAISFGVSINYYKFPLYEAFEDARNLLFGKAKTFGNKNNFAVALHKASGQSSGYVCCMESKQETKDTVFQKIVEYHEMIRHYKEAESEQLLHSILYHIENQKELYKIALGEDGKRDRFFRNVFDSSMQKKYGEYIESVNMLAGKIAGTQTESGNSDTIAPLQKDSEDALTSVLRTAKFLVEERG